MLASVLAAPSGCWHWTCSGRCQALGCSLMSSLSVQPSQRVRKGWSGSKRWASLQICNRSKWIWMISAITHLSAPFSRASEWQYALHVLQEKAASNFDMDIHACSAAVSACERTGQWQHVLELWPVLQEVQEKANSQQKKLYELTETGPTHITRHLKRSLEWQWAVGYPFLAAKEEQMTHGFYKYIAGMQALCARELLEVVPRAESVMDMFCGSGTVLVEALRAGKHAIGTDVSPLALLVATHHTDAAHVDLYDLLEVSSELVASMESGNKGWHYLKSEISKLKEKPLRDVLHFILLVALSRVQDVTYLHSSSKGLNEVPEDGLPPCMFLGVARLYVARVRSLRARALASQCEIYRCDNRVLRLQEPVDAIVTGPPYPGVYDYHSPASSCADLLGGETLYDFCAPGYSIHGSKAPTNIDIPDDSSSATYAPGKEIGQNSLWQQDPEFADKWQAEQAEWLASAFENLRDGGTATLMIGDGDLHSAGDGGFDNLQPTIQAAEQVGFLTVATATISGKSKHPKQPKGMKRTEHIVHLQKPRKRPRGLISDKASRKPSVKPRWCLTLLERLEKLGDGLVKVAIFRWELPGQVVFTLHTCSIDQIEMFSHCSWDCDHLTTDDDGTWLMMTQLHIYTSIDSARPKCLPKSGPVVNMFGEFEDHESMIFPWFILQDLPQTFHFHLGYGDSVAISSLCLKDFECGFLWISLDFLWFLAVFLFHKAHPDGRRKTQPVRPGDGGLKSFDLAMITQCLLDVPGHPWSMLLFQPCIAQADWHTVTAIVTCF